MNNVVPTILIGLGGLGSSIVDKIYAKIPKERRSRVAVHAFDTNLNDIGKLTYLGRDQITQTSSNRTVGQYLRDTDTSVRDWFPHNQAVLLDKSLTDGAGQVRAISRLAYRAAIEEGKLGQFGKSITHIFRATGEVSSKSTRVMIISSLAGGTGAGIFLQTAMYVRDILKQNYLQENVLIRGAFMLPDILVKSEALGKSEVESVYANAYASIKELNAITLNASSNNDDKFKLTIELEYKPSQRDSKGRVNYSINDKRAPYDFCFLYDFENTNGENLKYLDNYINQIVRSTYIDLFSPISGDRFSKQDNQILNLVQNKGKSRYVGSGISSIVYPYESMVDYCALRWATDSLSQDWLYFDEQYEILLKRYEEDKKQGIKRERPDRGSEFLTLLKSKAEEQKANSFFKEIYASQHLLDEDEEIMRDSPKPILFLNAIEKFIKDEIEKDKKLSQLKKETQLDEDRLENEDSIIDEVSTLQGKIKKYKKSIDEFLNNRPSTLAYRIILEDQREDKFLGGQDYRLNTWILAKDKPLHPVAIRAFLYSCSHEIGKRLGKIKPKNTELLKRTDEKRYLSNLEAEDHETIRPPDQIVRDLVENKKWKRPFNLGKSKAEKWIQDTYLDSTEDYVRSLNSYVENQFLEVVLTEIKEQIDTLSKDFEKYFLALKSGLPSLNESLETEATKHEQVGDMTQLYVLGTQKEKELIWDRINSFFLDQSLPTEISRQIYNGQYERFCQKQQQEFVPELKEEKLITHFKNDVIGWCSKELANSEELNMNCIQAINKEANFKRLDEEERREYLREKLSKVNNLALPFAPRAKNPLNTREINAWGVNPESVDELSREAILELFDESELVNDEAFSRFEILRNRTIFGYLIDDFEKFYCGHMDLNISPGAYYQAYQNRIERIKSAGNTVTPHLDKRWHNLAYLPDISEEKTTLDRKKVDRAFVWGLMMGSLKSSDVYGQKSWSFFGQDSAYTILQNGRRIGSDLMDLRNALFYNPGIVDMVISHYENQAESDKREFGIDLTKHVLYENIKNITYLKHSKNENILELIINLNKGDVSDEEFEKAIPELLDLLVDELLDYHLLIYGKSRVQIGLGKLKDLFIELRAGSPTYNSTERNSSQFQLWRAKVEDKVEKLKPN